MDQSIHYEKRVLAWKLGRLPEYKMLKFSMGMSLALGLIAATPLLFASVGANDAVRLAVSAYLAFSCLYGFIVLRRLKRETRSLGEIGRTSRLLAIPLILLGLPGNIFLLISGFYLLFKKKNLEYQLAIYAFVVSWSTILLSLLNLFKPYVANRFPMGMLLLIAMALFLAVVMVLTQIWVGPKTIHKRMLPVAVVLLFLLVTGNIFAFLLGLALLAKYRHRGEESKLEWVDVLSRLFRNNMSALGMFFIIFLVSLSVMSALTFDPSMAIDNDYGALFISPCLTHPFGTDNYGRDVFTRIVMGAQISLVVGCIATLVPVLLGGLLGSMAGYFGGKTDNLIMRLLDILYAVPGILLAIAIVAAFGANTFNLIMALSLGGIPSYSRIVRATVMSVANNEFVEAARACGAGHRRIILRHILPNSLAPVIVNATLGIGSTVLSTSALSYLGLGVEPHIPEWGNILKSGSAYIETHSYLAVFPGLAIILIVLAFNFFGDGLRDALDPKMK